MVDNFKYQFSKLVMNLLQFIESWLLKAVTILYLVIIILMSIDVIEANTIVQYISILISNNLDIFATMSSIFIGIYFTVLTLFMSFSTIDVVKDMEYDQIKKMIAYIIIGFLFSFSLLLVSLFSAPTDELILYIYSYLLLMMLLNTLRFGLVLLLWVNKFVKNFARRQADIQREERFNKELNEKLDEFLKLEEIKRIHERNK